MWLTVDIYIFIYMKGDYFKCSFKLGPIIRETHTSDSGKIIAIVLWNQVSVNNDKTNWNVSRDVHGIFLSLFYIGSYFCLLKLCAVLILRLKPYVYDFFSFFDVEVLYVFFSWNFFKFPSHTEIWPLFISNSSVSPFLSFSNTLTAYRPLCVLGPHISDCLHIVLNLSL